MILVNDVELKKDYFSNTEVRIHEFQINAYYNRIDLKYETENPEYKINDDLMILYFVKQEFDKAGVQVDLYLRTMPYQRMDHKSGRYLHTLPYVAKFINDLKFKEVFVIEPHSSETKKYLDDNARMIYPVVDMLKNIIDSALAEIVGDIHVVFPDAGAFKRYNESLTWECDVCVFTKKREHDTNNIIKHEISTGHITRGSTCFILDDICSSGQTLLDVAYYAKMAGAAKIYVVTAHCENLALQGELLSKRSPINMMFTTNSMISCEHPKITYLN